MCDFGEPGKPFVQLSRCPHGGTIHLTVNRTTLHLTPEELIALHEKLCECVRLDKQTGEPLPKRTPRFGLN